MENYNHHDMENYNHHDMEKTASERSKASPVGSGNLGPKQASNLRWSNSIPKRILFVKNSTKQK